MANTGKTVIVAALDGTFQRKVKHPFWYRSCFGTLVEPTQQHLPCCLTGLWEHPEPGAAGGERGEAERCVHGVLPRGLLHQEAGSRAGGECPWNRNCFTFSPAGTETPSGSRARALQPLVFPCQVEVIGGADKYHSVCRACYFRARPQQPGPDNKENVPLGLRQLETAAPRNIVT
uniref:Thymidine kinase n=1 Tax=Zonotrichia albicollis TaxID=44394 RepID=A0A8D2QIY4_ZONAL